MAATRPDSEAAVTQPEKIAVIGSGLMGHGIAQIFAAHGHPVLIIDPNQASLDTVHERIVANLTAMVATASPLPMNRMLSPAGSP